MRHRKIEQDIASRGGVKMERATATDTCLPGYHPPPSILKTRTCRGTKLGASRAGAILRDHQPGRAASRSQPDQSNPRGKSEQNEHSLGQQ